MIQSAQKFSWKPVLAASLAIAVLFNAETASAHHPFGGTTPDNWLEGFLSGLGHPMIGMDHLAFVIAAGCIAVLYGKRGLIIPIVFVLMTLAGTGLHLQELNLPVPELVISASVLGFGVLLTLTRTLPLIAIALLASLAGIFHGYAYGEAIVGAEMSPLVSYLAGFTLIQLAVAVGVAQLAQRLIRIDETDTLKLPLRFAGFALSGVGFAFLSSTVLG